MKKIISLFLSLVMLLSITAGFEVSAKAENNTIGTAYELAAGGGAYRPQNRWYRRQYADRKARGKERYRPGRIHAVQAQNTQAWDGLCHDD